MVAEVSALRCSIPDCVGVTPPPSSPVDSSPRAKLENENAISTLVFRIIEHKEAAAAAPLSEKKVVIQRVEAPQIEHKDAPKETTVVAPSGEKKVVVQSEETPQVEKPKTVLDDSEVAFVQARKKHLHDRLTEWKKDYEPAPFFALSWVGGVSKIIRKESMKALSVFMDKLEASETRKKLICILEKNKQVLVENMFCMNSATESKMKQACQFIDEELVELKKNGPNESKPSESVKKEKKGLSKDDPLLESKTQIWTSLEKWKQGFVPAPAGLLGCVPGVASTLQGITDRLFNDVFRDIRHAKTASKLTETLAEHKEIITDYTVFVNQQTANKLEEACAILSQKPEKAASPVSS